MGIDAEFQAIIPVRGKILNCLKAEYDKIFKNEIITDLIKAWAAGWRLKTKANSELHSFDLLPAEMEQGYYLYRCGCRRFSNTHSDPYDALPSVPADDKGFADRTELPLYELTDKDKTYFAYTDREKSLTFV